MPPKDSKKGKKKKSSKKKSKLAEDQKVLYELYRRAEMNDVVGAQALFDNPENDQKFDLKEGAAGMALVKACERGSEAMIRLLLEKGVPLEYQSGKPLQRACSAKQISVVKMLLNLSPVQADVNSKAVFTEITPLHEAVRAGSPLLVNYLLEHGADVNAAAHPENCASFNGWAAIHFAADLGHFDIVRLLIERGAAIDQPTTCEDTAIGLAAETGHFDILRYLVSRGASIHTKRRELSVVQWAIYRAQPDIVQFLVASGANPALSTAPTWFPGRISLKELIKREFSAPLCEEIDLAIYRGGLERKTRSSVRRIIGEVRWCIEAKKAPPPRSEMDDLSGLSTGPPAEEEQVVVEEKSLLDERFVEDGKKFRMVETILAYVF